MWNLLLKMYNNTRDEKASGFASWRSLNVRAAENLKTDYLKVVKILEQFMKKKIV